MNLSRNEALQRDENRSDSESKEIFKKLALGLGIWERLELVQNQINKFGIDATLNWNQHSETYRGKISKDKRVEGHIILLSLFCFTFPQKISSDKLDKLNTPEA